MATSLFDPSFARELEALRRRLTVRARSGAAGDRGAKRRGSSAEFLEHRPYAQGDDPRRIDWLAYARAGEPVMKTFRAEEDVIVRLVVDASASLEFGTPTKLHAAKRIAASIAYMALAESERAQVIAAESGSARGSEPSRGRAALPKVLRTLDAIQAKGGTDLAGTLEAVIGRSSRPGLLVVLSDFMDPGAYDTALTRAAAAGHDLVLVQVLAEEEIAPQMDGDFALEDVETGATVDVTLDPRALRAYLARLEGLFASLRALAKKTRAAYVRAPSHEPTLAVVRRVVARAVD